MCNRKVLKDSDDLVISIPALIALVWMLGFGIPSIFAGPADSGWFAMMSVRGGITLWIILYVLIGIGAAIFYVARFCIRQVKRLFS